MLRLRLLDQNSIYKHKIDSRMVAFAIGIWEASWLTRNRCTLHLIEIESAVAQLLLTLFYFLHHSRFNQPPLFSNVFLSIMNSISIQVCSKLLSPGSSSSLRKQVLSRFQFTLFAATLLHQSKSIDRNQMNSLCFET